MAGEMYLQKCTQFHGGEYIGADVEGNISECILCLSEVGFNVRAW